MVSLLLGVLLAAGDPRLVDVARLIPDSVVDMRYATADNFLHRKVYPVARCLLRRDVAERLAHAAARLRAEGYRLLLWDCYRPRSVQWEMWKLVTDTRYVADPRRGSNHNRAAAVDLSLVTADGRPVEMPTAFDSFEERAFAAAVEGVSQEAQQNRARLRRAMVAEGFRVRRTEWWHFDASDAGSYPVLDEPLETAAQ